jgi:glycosyltransferase involved in cell wall biosynthesis
MKIKYIGNFTDGTGWAKASTYNALALHYAGHDVSCFELKYNQMNNLIEPELQELLDKNPDSYDILIQHILPDNYKLNGGVENIGFTVLENVEFSNMSWIKNMQMMDKMLVPNVGTQRALEKYSISSKLFPHTFNYEKIVHSPRQANIAELNKTFNFVFVGEFTKRKNLEALIRAFHTEFDENEFVNLYIKTWGVSLDAVTNFSNSIKNKLKKCNTYKKEIIICDYIPEEVLWSTMNQCHAFVMPSYGEAWCYPAMEAMALGIPVIYTDGIGIDEFNIDNSCGFKVKSSEVPCYDSMDALPDLYTSKDTWLEINVLDLQQKMRELYNIFFQDTDRYKQLSSYCSYTASTFDYKNNKIIKDVL